MTTIRTIYSTEPEFPATDQHPDAIRYQVGNVWVEAIGGEPSQDEIDALLNPPAPPKTEFELMRDYIAAKDDAPAELKRLVAEQAQAAEALAKS